MDLAGRVPNDNHEEVTPSDLTEALLTASRVLVAVAARSLAIGDSDVTLVQYRALVVLASRGPHHVGELAHALDVHPSTATRLCDRLVARNLIRRAVDRVNRRETVVELAAAGRALVERVTDVRRTEISGIVGRIPDGLRRPAVAALLAFSAAAGEPADRAWTLGWS
jgi:DNA-binding MarR family transcriptional regulator